MEFDAFAFVHMSSELNLFFYSFRFLFIFVPAYCSPVCCYEHSSRQQAKVCCTAFTFRICPICDCLASQLFKRFTVKSVQLWLPCCDKHKFIIRSKLNVICEHFWNIDCFNWFWCVLNIPDMNLTANTTWNNVLVRMIESCIINFIFVSFEPCSYWAFFRVPNLNQSIRACWEKLVSIVWIL